MRLISITINFCNCKPGAVSLVATSLPWECFEVSALQDHFNADSRHSRRKRGDGGDHGVSATSLATHHSTNTEEEFLQLRNTLSQLQYLMERVNSSWHRKMLLPCAGWLGLSAAVHGYVVNLAKPKKRLPLLPQNCESIW